MSKKPASTHSATLKTHNTKPVRQTLHPESETSPQSATDTGQTAVDSVDTSKPRDLVRPSVQEGVVVVAGPTPRRAIAGHRKYIDFPRDLPTLELAPLPGSMSQVAGVTPPVRAGESATTEQVDFKLDAPPATRRPALRRGSAEERRAVLAALDKTYGRGHHTDN